MSDNPEGELELLTVGPPGGSGLDSDPGPWCGTGQGSVEIFGVGRHLEAWLQAKRS